MKRLALLALPLAVLAQDSDVLSSTQQDILDTKRKIINEDKSIDKKSWLSDISLSAKLSKDEDKDTTKSIGVSVEQNIFKFGGIGYSIDLASLQEQYDLLNLHVSYKDFLNTIYTSVLDIKIAELNIQKAELNIKNKAIAIKIKQDEYKAGQVDVVELNDAMIEKSSLEENLVELEASLQKSKDELKKYSNLDYDKIEIPKMKILDEDVFMKNSDDINLASKNIDIANLNYKIKKTDYLPKLYFTLGGGYQDTSSSEGKYYDYGLKVSMPFDFSFTNEIEKSRLNLLLANQQKIQTKIDKSVEFKKISTEIQKYKSLMDIANKDIVLYAELLEVTNEEFKAGYKAKEDVEVLSNTKTTRELDAKLNSLYIEQQILGYYF